MRPLIMPADFNIELYQMLGKAMSKYSDLRAWKGWASGHNALRFRYRAAVEADIRFCDSFSIAGERYPQEEALFSFFVNATACVECYLYSLYHIGAVFAPTGFDICSDKALRKIRPEYVAESFAKTFLNDDIIAVINSIVLDPLRKQILEFRDTMAHRGAIPREHTLKSSDPKNIKIPEDIDAVYLRASPKSAMDTGARMKLDESTTHQLRAWLATQVTNLLSATHNFVEQREK